MRLRCQFEYYPQPYEPELYLRPVAIDVVCHSEPDSEAIAGRIALDHLDLVRAETTGENVHDICDADSGGWEAVYAALFEPALDFAEIRGDFKFNDPINHLLFLYRSVFHPVLRDWESFILDHVATLFGEDSALVMWKKETDLSDRELARLGFRIVAGHDLLFRPNMLRHEYCASSDDRDLLDFSVDKSVEEYVLREWTKDSRGVSLDGQDTPF
jgi:hypothetical protein